MYEILVISHSTLCKGFNEAVGMILGPETSVECLALDEEGIEIFHEKLKEKIEKIKSQNEEVLILADLFGGSPFNRAFCEAGKDEKIKVIAGVNLSMIIEAIMNKTSNLDEVVLNIVESGKGSITQGIILNNNDLDDE
ncbi:PTS sugar transporter subunit IIA [Clostridium paraputrificum]|uniref:PTS sugar transporter subunit IIA n=1 Tax=Clostridium paraputrificum TaxID=29363 RepID=UPI003D33C39C